MKTNNLIPFPQVDEQIFQEIGFKMHLYTDFKMHQHRFAGNVYGCQWMGPSLQLVGRRHHKKQLDFSTRSSRTVPFVSG